MSDIRNCTRLFTRKAISTAFFMGCLASPAHAAITFQFNYTDPVGTGFLDPVSGPVRQAELNTAASAFSNMFGSHFGATGKIVVDADTTDKPGELAGATSYLMDPRAPGFNLGEVVRTKLQSGIDLNGGHADGVVSINFNQPWNLDINSPPTQGQYDFYSILDHEFTHLVGFTSGGIKESGKPFFGTKEAGTWDTFASYLVDKNDAKIIDPTTFALNQADWNVSSTSDLLFDGPNAEAANGGQAVKLYTPPLWDPASSVSHLDPSYGTLMGPYGHKDSETRNYSLIEIGILKDLGYVSAVPEPETYSMLLAGLAVCGWVARRRQQT